MATPSGSGRPTSPNPGFDTQTASTNGAASFLCVKNAPDTHGEEATPVIIEPGERLVRVVSPAHNSHDDGAFWMREADFKALQSKPEWRRKCAVWANWNRDGEYVTYTVPPGEGLKVWEGPAASQQMKINPDYVLEG